MRVLLPRGLAIVAACLLLAGPAAAQSAPGSGLSGLQKALRHDLRRAHGHSSALVVDLATGQTLFAAAPNVPRPPASVEKLYTTTTALSKLGASTRLQTSVYGRGRLTADGTWHGTLFLRGGGDPTFGDAAFVHAAYGAGATVQGLAAALVGAGIHRVAGRIIGDESYLDSRRGTVATGFRPDLEYEGELSGLAFDAGFQSSCETALQRRPALFAAHALVGALRAAHVHVPGSTPVYTGVTPAGATLLAGVRSPTLATLMQLTNSPSDNFFAETLLKDLGARFAGAGTTAAGAEIVRAVIAQQFGLTPALDDGSGLSRDDRTTTAQVVTLLERMAANPTFLNSLAIAGVRGTMQHEMLGTRAVDNCRGKTGTLSDVANLVGYCTAANGDRLVFAFLVQGLRNTDAGHWWEDQMGIALADYTG